MFDLSIGKLLVIGILALFLVGPDKLPQYAAQLGKWVRVARSMLDEAKGRVSNELGPEFNDLDWTTLDPRRYDPRRLIADAWNSAPDSLRPQQSDPVPASVPVEADLLELADRRAESTAPAATTTVRYDVAS